MTSLTRGANSPIDTATTTVEVTGARQGTVDVFVFQLGADLKVRTDADLVFFNNPSTPEGAVTVTGGQVTLQLAAVPAAISTLAVAVALDENVPCSLAEVPDLSVTLTQAGGTSFAIPAEGLKTERSAVLLEVYRRNGSWKVRNRSAGWSGGLDALVTEHGVSVDETPAQAPEPAQSAVAAATSATVDGEGVRTVPPRCSHRPLGAAVPALTPGPALPNLCPKGRTAYVRIDHHPHSRRRHADRRHRKRRRHRCCLEGPALALVPKHPNRHRPSAPEWRTEMADRFAVWQEVTAVDAAA